MTHFEGLGTVYDQVSQAFSCCKKFANDDTHKAQSDIYLHDTKDIRYITWQYNKPQALETVSMQGFDQFDLISIHVGESGVDIQYTSEDCDRAGAYNDGCLVGTEPYNENWSQGRFGKGIQDY